MRNYYHKYSCAVMFAQKRMFQGFIRPHPSVRNCAKSHTVHRVNEATKKDCLLQELQTIVSSNFEYKMLGKELVLPTKCLQMICKKARCIVKMTFVYLDYMNILLFDQFIKLKICKHANVMTACLLWRFG